MTATPTTTEDNERQNREHAANMVQQSCTGADSWPSSSDDGTAFAMVSQVASPPCWAIESRRAHGRLRVRRNVGGCSPDGAVGFGSPILRDASPSGDGGGAEAANAVSLLQEYIQSCSSFSPHTKILTWSFEQQLENDTSLQFRATVSFVFGDVPHHFSGGWQTSKKKAQRDTAERVRHFLTRRLEQRHGGEDVAHAAIDPKTMPAGVVQELEGLCEDAPERPVVSGLVEWEVEEGAPADQEEPVGAQYRATMTFHIQSVPHCFAGAWAFTADAARRDTAERVLWYFGKGKEVFAAVDRAAVCASAAPPPQLASLGAGGTPAGVSPTACKPQQAVEDKTILMQVQNALQKTFSKDTPPGQRVWVWSYEADDHDPQLFRAHVEVPSWERTFIGEWCRGKKLAQRNACFAVKQYLDEMPDSAS